MKEKGVQLIAVLHERQSEGNVPTGELSGDELLVGAQEIRTWKDERE